MKIVVIIPAAGLGTRMASPQVAKPSKPAATKQFVELLGTPVLVHTLRKFASNPEIGEIYVPLRKSEIESFRQRLEREHRITGASTFTDRSSAEHAVGEAIAHSRDRIDRWMGRPGGHPNLVLDYDSPIPVGRTLNRGESQPHPCSHVLVVLKYSEPNDYYVLTSYPECRQ